MTKILANFSSKHYYFCLYLLLDCKMDVNVLKVSSIYNKNDPNKFLYDLRRKIGMDYEQFKDITSVHIEQLKNERYHLRMQIKDGNIIEKLKQKSELNADGKSYTLRFDLYSYLIMTPDQTNERIVFEYTDYNNARILKIRKLPKQHILDILNKLNNYGSKHTEYVSVNNTHAFVGYKDNKDARKIMKKFIKDGFETNLAQSCLKIIKSSGNFHNIHQHQNKGIHHSKYSQAAPRSQHPYKKTPKKERKTRKEKDQHHPTTSSNKFSLKSFDNNINQSVPQLPMNFQPFPTFINTFSSNRQPLVTTIPSQSMQVQHFNPMSFPVNQYPFYNFPIAPNNYVNSHSMYNDYNLAMFPKYTM
ncbi:hypothetical protein ACKWTF_007384 [Chironomus riparius]